MINVSKLYPKLILFPFFWLLACGLMLPSDGNHGITSPKSLSFLITSSAIFLYFLIKRRISTYQFSLISFTFLAFAVLSTYLFVAVAQDVDSFSVGMDQFKLFIITWVVAAIALFLISDRALTGSGFLKAVIYFNCAFSTMKVVGVILHLTGVIKLWKLMELSGIRFMSMSVTDNFSRLQTSVDIVTPYLLFFVLQNNLFGLKLNNKFRVFFIIVSLLSICLSFSRFLLAVACAAFFFYWISLNIPKMMRALLIGCLFVIASVAMVGIDTAESVFHTRFTSISNYRSDETRQVQIEALMAEHDNHQLLGKGLGGTANGYLRDSTLTHLYEVQWVAFLMQFGGLGIFLLMAPLAYICMVILTTPLDIVKIELFCMFGIWILSGFTNPYMISLTSGIVYACFIVAGDILGKKWSTPVPSAAIPLKNT